jgi:hypothetical protein
MPAVTPFHSANEKRKQAVERIYHNNDVCTLGRFIPNRSRVPGTAGYKLCPDCERLNKHGQ